MLRILPVAVLLCGTLASAQTPVRRALAIEDYYRMQTVGNPAISPNGRWVTYSVSTRVEEDNSTRTENWVVLTTGSGSPRRLLHYGRDITGPRWSEDSRIIYSADRETWAIDPERDAAAAP